MTRTGAFLPREGRDESQGEGSLPIVAYRNFWGILASAEDQIWQDWPLNGVGHVPDDVKRHLKDADVEPSERGVYYHNGETCVCCAFNENGIVVPIHRLCEHRRVRENNGVPLNPIPHCSF